MPRERPPVFVDPFRADKLTDSICRLACAIRELAEIVAENKNLAVLNRLDQLEKNMADQLDDIIEDIEEQKTLIAGVSTLVTGLKAQLVEALAGVTLPPAVKAKIDKIWADTEANKTALATALTDNTPAATPPVP